MKLTFRSFLCLFAFLVAMPSVTAEQWHGIVPLRSTREDVVRLLGQCSGDTNRCEFNLATEDVFIVFSGPEACPDRIPAGSVLSIERDLETPTTLTALGLNDKRFKTFDPSWPRNVGYLAYIDEKAGLILKAFGGGVFQIDYIPAKRDRNLCPSYYRKPREFVEAIAEHAPIVSIRCPKNTPTAGEIIPLRADYIRSGLRICLQWQASAGRIVEGQGRRRILLDTTGLEGQRITVSVERADTLHYVSMDTCKLEISARIKN